MENEWAGILMKLVPSNLTHHDWKKLNKKQREIICREIEKRSAGSLFWHDSEIDEGVPPSFIHNSTGIEFILIPSGTFCFGLSEAEERAANAICLPLPMNVEEMRPVRQKSVGAFLLSKWPVLARTIRSVFPEINAVIREQDDFPAFVGKKFAEQVCRAVGGTLPTEIQWEYACRGGTKTLFVWGDQILNQSGLSRWLLTDFSKADELAHNSFGLHALFNGEWCSDPFRVSHKTTASVQPNAWVIKGGGSHFWPWQDEEWVWCMPAMRMPSTDLSEDKTAAFRIALTVPNLLSPKRSMTKRKK